MDRLHNLAAQWGVEPSYFDIHGRRRDASPETLQRVVEALTARHSPQTWQTPHRQPAYEGDGRKTWVLAVQLYAVRSRGNWGHGDFTDLARLLELVAELGGGGIGLNPLHAQFYDRPGTGSPYSPSSRLFFNPLYIDVEAVEEFSPEQAEPLRGEIDRLRATELVDYQAVADLKLAALRAAYRRFATTGSAMRRQDFEAYKQERGLPLLRFAAFETLRRRWQGAWWQWPDEWRNPDDEALRRLRGSAADEIEFHQYLQWNTERQLQRCRTIAGERGLAIGLYLDTAIGVDPAGADAWMDQHEILVGLSVGAPPDQYNPAGQDWGLTAYNPHGLMATAFDPFRQILRAAMRYAGAIRIDHVLGLMRLYVIPHGSDAEGGAYLRFPFAAMLAVVADESRRWRCLVIGEDLGTVPENFRSVLAAWGVWSYLVMLFERNADGSFRRPNEYPERAIATFGTHDLPTFTGWISGHDLSTKRGIGIDLGESDDERVRSRTALDAAVGAATGPLRTFADIVAFLAMTSTRLISVGIEDVLELKDQVNVPGTVTEHPNWRMRWPLALEEVASDQRLRGVAAILAGAGRGSPSSA